MQNIEDLKITIRELSPAHSLEELTILLNRSYKSLADLGFIFLASHQDTSTTKDRVSKGKCFIALIHERIIGTISYYPPDRTTGSPWYDKPGVASFGQFAIDPAFQKLGLGHKLLRLVEQHAFESGAENLALDTAEGARHLVEYYEKRGYTMVEYAQWTVVNYRSVIMNKSIKPAVQRIHPAIIKKPARGTFL